MKPWYLHVLPCITKNPYKNIKPLQLVTHHNIMNLNLMNIMNIIRVHLIFHPKWEPAARMVSRVPSSDGAILVLGGGAETGSRPYGNHWKLMMFQVSLPSKIPPKTPMLTTNKPLNAWWVFSHQPPWRVMTRDTLKPTLQNFVLCFGSYKPSLLWDQ